MTAPTSRTPWTIVAGVGLGLFLGLLSPNSLPLVIGALLEGLAISDAQAGAIGTLELLAVAVAALAVSSKAGRISCARLATAGAVIAIGGQLVSAYTDSLPVLLVARTVVGAALGLVYAAAAMVAASTVNPDRTIGYGNTSALIGIVLYLPGLALVIERYGYRGAFIALAVLTACLIPVLRWLQFQAAGQTPAKTETKLPAKSLFALLASITFFNVGAGAVWGFSERMGVQAGFSVDQIGLIIALGTISGMVGSVFAGWLGDRWGRSMPIAAALIAAGFTYLVLAQTTHSITYIVGINLYWLTYMFLFPLFIGTGAMLESDKSGRAATIAAAVLMLTIAIGPVCGGLIATWFSYSAIGWFSLAACLLSVAAFRFVDLEPASLLPEPQMQTDERRAAQDRIDSRSKLL